MEEQANIILQALLANPAVAALVVIGVICVAKLLKASWQAIKVIIIFGIIYIAFTCLGLV